MIRRRMIRRCTTVALLGGLVGCAVPGAFARAASRDPGAEMALVGDETGKAAGADERPWVKHKVVPRERLEDIEARYGVSTKELVRWNKRLKKKQWIYAGQTLRIKARRVPPPREKITYVVKKGDRWAEIAKTYGVRETDLRYWNRKVPRAFRIGQKLTVYTNPMEVPAATAAEQATGDSPPRIPEVAVRAGGLSVGKPNRGRIQNGVQLPKSEFYTLRDPERSYGSSHAVKIVHDSIASFRVETGYSGELKIADMSKRGGGRLRPHSSHQSGRDIDIRLPKRRGAGKKDRSTRAIDWDLSWSLVKAFVDSGEIEYIFLETSRQKLLRAAAKRAGATDAEIKKAIQYPSKRGTNKGIVRHAKGHTMHIHVRVKCAKSNSRCDSY